MRQGRSEHIPAGDQSLPERLRATLTKRDYRFQSTTTTKIYIYIRKRSYEIEQRCNIRLTSSNQRVRVGVRVFRECVLRVGVLRVILVIRVIQRGSESLGDDSLVIHNGRRFCF